MQTKIEYFGLQAGANIITYNIWPCQGVSHKNNTFNCNSLRKLLQFILCDWRKNPHKTQKPVYNTPIGAKRYNLRIPAVSGNWKLNG